MYCATPDDTESNRTVQVNLNAPGIDSELELALREMRELSAGPAMVTFAVVEPQLNAGQRLVVVGDCIGSFDPAKGLELRRAGAEGGEAVWRTDAAAVVNAPAAVQYAYVVVDEAHTLFEPVPQRSVEVASAGCCVNVTDRWWRPGHVSLNVGPIPRPAEEPEAPAEEAGLAATLKPTATTAEAAALKEAGSGSEGEAGSGGEGAVYVRRFGVADGTSHYHRARRCALLARPRPAAFAAQHRLLPCPRCCPEARPASPTGPDARPVSPAPADRPASPPASPPAPAAAAPRRRFGARPPKAAAGPATLPAAIAAA